MLREWFHIVINALSKRVSLGPSLNLQQKVMLVAKHRGGNQTPLTPQKEFFNWL